MCTQNLSSRPWPWDQSHVYLISFCSSNFLTASSNAEKGSQVELGVARLMSQDWVRQMISLRGLIMGPGSYGIIVERIQSQLFRSQDRSNWIGAMPILTRSLILTTKKNIFRRGYNGKFSSIRELLRQPPFDFQRGLYTTKA